MTNQDIMQSSTPAILIVDDNPHNLQVLGKLLQENNYEIEFATSGEATLEWLKKRQFDLILLDINMPGMNGFEVCMKIRSNPDMNDVPVIFLSAESERESILKGFELGAQDYITKPFDSRELLARVRTHLALKGSLEKLEDLNRSLEEKVIERTYQLNVANAKLEATNVKLIDLDRTKSDFLNLISHEIRTPLNGIIGPLELLKEPTHSREILELIEILDMSVKRLERFALNALLITRLKTKQFEIRKDRISLTNIINEVLIEEKSKYQTKKIVVNFKNEVDGAIILGEIELIRKCVRNILENAIQFSSPGGIIDISLDNEEQNTFCEIRDNGCGFPTGVTDHLFELFVIGDENKDNCTGMGLPIAKMIMEAHGGDIIICNNYEGGASVKLLFQNSMLE
jgi:two-component system, sensor histidine kinase and response regulator